MFRYLIVFFLILLTDFSFGQIVVLTQTHSDARIDLDRKAFLGLGNTSLSSDGYAHDFTLPAKTDPCQQITGISVDISITNYTHIGPCPNYETYYNLFYGCDSYSGGATCLEANLLAQPNFPPNTSPPIFNFGSTLGFDFGGNLSVDIIPVSNAGCNAVANGSIIYEYTITVTVTVTVTPKPAAVVTNAAICSGETYNWAVNNVTYTTEQLGLSIPGVGCTSDEILNLTITNQPIQPTLSCYETATFNASTCSWEVTGTQPVQPPVVDCWDNFVFNTTTCVWDNTGVQPGNIIEEYLELCEGNTLTLQAQTNLSNPSYVWSTGENSDEIIIDAAGTFSVYITDGVCSIETRIFNIELLETPIIQSVVSDGNDFIVTTSNIGYFSYSLDGNIFQTSNIFYNVEGGLYTIYVKQSDCINGVTIQHLHFYIPKFFTPNNDGAHDTFGLTGIEYYDSSQVSIFNRYGKLIKFSQNGPFSWDGTFNNVQLPSDDYWYVIIINNQKFNGHFSLKR